MDIYNILTWAFLIGVFWLAIMLQEDDDDDWTQSKVYKDLRETTLNREDH